MSINLFKKFREGLRRDKNQNIEHFKSLFESFQQILAGNNYILETISEMGDRLSGEYIFDMKYLRDRVQQLSEAVYRNIYHLNKLTGNQYTELFQQYERIHKDLQTMVEEGPSSLSKRLCVPYSEINTDVSDLTGDKNAHLGELRNEIQIRTPDGFAVTTTAFRLFMDHNDLWRKVEEEVRSLRQNEKPDREHYNRAIAELFSSAEVPRELAKEVQKNINGLYRRTDSKPLLAVRSSAFGEDRVGKSYAGQFLTVLNCRSEDVLRAYKRVVASRFYYSAIVYGNEDEEGNYDLNAVPMAVGVQEMITSTAAGVLYTVDPSGCIDCLIISAVWGLANEVVAGMTESDYFQILRLDPSQIVKRRIGKKNRPPATGTPPEPAHLSVPGDPSTEQPCLSDGQLTKLAEMALTMERYFQRPLDIEWCLDRNNEFCILQCRPLQLSRRPVKRTGELLEVTRRAPIIMQGRGQVAQRGIAAGKVWQVKEDDDPEQFPVGAIAVSRFTSPRLTSIIRKASAIITDVGSSTGHMATIAREFAVPTIVGTEKATGLLTTGMEITVDAEENIIYRGIIKELLEYELHSEDTFREMKEYQILRRLLKRISPLRMIDPRRPDFTARNCRSYHDLIRFCHEKAMQTLIELNLSAHRFRKVKPKQLKLPIPLGLSIVDLGGGVDKEHAGGATESLDSIRSIPMLAIIEGLTAPGVWSTQPVQLGLNDFMSSVTRYSMMDRTGYNQGRNLAVLAEHYLNLSLRLGYHFNVVDTYVSDNINDNYIYFRFVGGVTEDERRHRRALLLEEILKKMEFWVAITGDLVIARLTKCKAEDMLKTLVVLGKLIGFTRQLDTQLLQDEDIEKYRKEFFRLCES